MPRKPKLSAEERSRINRANASKSTGPRTPEGKAKSRLNACRHGLTGQFITIQSQDLAAYVRHGRELVLGFNPIGPEEVTLTQYLIDAAWLMHHANTLEINARAMAGLDVAHDAEQLDELALTCADHFFHLVPQVHEGKNGEMRRDRLPMGAVSI